MSQPLKEPNIEFKKTLKIVMLVSVIYLTLVSISIPTLIIIAVIVTCSIGLLKLKLSQIREKGPDNFSPKLRQLLLEKSIFDVYSDILYFPTVSRIIGAFIRPVLGKPRPQDLQLSFRNIHPKARQIISTKGILNIFPDKIRAIGLKEDQPLPLRKNDWTWYNTQTYKLHEQVHQDTMGKRIVQKIDNKVNWSTLTGLVLLVAYGIKTMNPKRARKMLIQNSCFAGIMIVVMIGLIKLSRRNKMNKKSGNLLLEVPELQE